MDESHQVLLDYMNERWLFLSGKDKETATDQLQEVLKRYIAFLRKSRLQLTKLPSEQRRWLAQRFAQEHSSWLASQYALSTSEEAESLLYWVAVRFNIWKCGLL